jgi:hypothetical protein
MRGLLIFILLSAATYYLLKNILRFFALFISGKDKFNHYHTYKSYKKNEGKIVIDNISQKEKHFKKDSGEYIDFEEIK